MFAVLCVQYEKAGAVRTLVLLEMYKPSSSAEEVSCRQYRETLGERERAGVKERK